MLKGIRLVSTDFDGTLFAEFENPPVPMRLQQLLKDLQDDGAKWVINTGRDMSSLMATLGRSNLMVKPDYLVLVERDIFLHRESSYVPHDPWNEQCRRAHEELFSRLQKDHKRLVDWINARFRAMIYEDPFSPVCVIAESNADMDIIHQFMDEYAEGIPHLAVVRNDVYARFGHSSFNKGTALAELTRMMGVSRDRVFAVGDHFNDLPMLNRQYAAMLAAPANAVPVTRAAIANQGGYQCSLPHGEGVAEALEHFLRVKTADAPNPESE